MTEFMRPTVTTEEVNDTVARFIVEPLERGYGYTLGNSMRRVLLSSLDGAKATAIQIDGQTLTRQLLPKRACHFRIGLLHMIDSHEDTLPID